MSRRHRILRALAGIASAMVLAITVAAGSVTLAASHLEGNVTKVDISHQVGRRATEADRDSTGPLTFLLMGSDRRTGAGNSGYGVFEGARSDTTMLVHLYEDRRSAVVVSIPRDTVVTLPKCVDSKGKVLPRVRDRFNQAFDRGGPGCTVKTVEAMTGLPIDHFVVLDFNGFKRTIAALGGVEVCLTHPVTDELSGIDLPAGRTRVDGEDALAFVRVRHNIGDGSDIGRISRQQVFLSSLIQEVSDSGLLTNPVRLWRVLQESTKSIATDPALAEPRAILPLAASVRHLRPADVTFVTLPWRPSGDGATVVIDQARAGALFRALAQEKPWPPPPTKGVDGRRLRVAPSRIVVDVHNASGVDRQGARAAEALAAQGFVVGAIDARERVRRTTIRHSADQAQAARTLQAAVPGSRLREVRGDSRRLDLLLGSDYDGIDAINVPGKSTATMAEVATADQDICTG